MLHDERRCRRRGVVGNVDIREFRSQPFHHIEVECRRVGVVEDVPCSEQQLVVSGLEFRNAVERRTAGVASEVEREVAVKVVRLRHIPVDDELHVMSYSRSRGVDAISVRNIRDKIWSTVDIASVDKRRTVEIAVYGRSYGVVCYGVRSVNLEVLRISVGDSRAVVAHRVEVHQPCAVRVVDVHRNCKRQCEHPVAYAIVTVVQRLRPVIELEGLVGFCWEVSFACYQFARVAHGS